MCDAKLDAANSIGDACSTYVSSAIAERSGAPALSSSKVKLTLFDGAPLVSTALQPNVSVPVKLERTV